MNKFKAGDKVRRIGGNCEFPVGTICTVIRADSGGWLELVGWEGKGFGFNPEYFELAPPKPHPHAELIKQWADDPSLVIQCRQCPEARWVVVPKPIWTHACEYRIKPDVDVEALKMKLESLTETQDELYEEIQSLQKRHNNVINQRAYLTRELQEHS